MITEEILEELINEANLRVVRRFIEVKCEQHDLEMGERLAKERVVWASIVLIQFIAIILILVFK